MQFQLDEDRALLQSSTRELLQAESPLEKTRTLMEESDEGFAPELYKKLGELGYMSLLLPEEDGGSGMGAVGLAAVLAEMGRVAFPGPYLDAILGIETLRRCVGEEAKGWLDKAVSGQALVLLAYREDLVHREPFRPAARFVDGRVVGRKTFVVYGASADALLVTTAEGLVLVPRPEDGWNTTPLPTIDHAQRFVIVDLDASGTLLADPEAAGDNLGAVVSIGAMGAAAVLLGLMERALEMTVAYTHEREAFGSPIGAFQSVQHRCADMLVKTESTRSAVFRAAWAADHEPEQFAYLAAVAKAWAGDAGRFVCGEAIQLHGGVGYTWEYDPHIYFKRVKTLEQFYGATREQIERVLHESPLMRAHAYVPVA